VINFNSALIAWLSGRELKHNEDKAGFEHWDSTERNTSLKVQPFEPTLGLRGFSRRLWHRFFDQTIFLLPGGR
jgi:hypothetical protein